MAESGAIVARSFLWKDQAWVQVSRHSVAGAELPWFF
jgi:hypothetical protein